MNYILELENLELSPSLVQGACLFSVAPTARPRRLQFSDYDSGFSCCNRKEPAKIDIIRCHTSWNGLTREERRITSLAGNIPQV